MGSEKRFGNFEGGQVKLTDSELEAVAGGAEPEEFDWHPRGFPTPIKGEGEDEDGNKGDLWEFHAIGTVEGQYFAYKGGRRK